MKGSSRMKIYSAIPEESWVTEEEQIHGKKDRTFEENANCSQKSQNRSPSHYPRTATKKNRVPSRSACLGDGRNGGQVIKKTFSELTVVCDLICDLLLPFDESDKGVVVLPMTVVNVVAGEAVSVEGEVDR
ncbi:hypothetical protein RUM43_005407 [Polyplax serrata]|uniref:Uncharacterized protein n=1 Tax=Polyplax serrata TaxID=468196 RepID=A0AAN8PWU8_POLSC